MKSRKTLLIVYTLLFCIFLTGKAQVVSERQDTIANDSVETEECLLYYCTNKADVQEVCLDNSKRIRRLRKVFAMSPRIDSIIIYSYASPEGGYERNIWLSKKRAESAKEFILQSIHNDSILDPDNIILRPMGEHWDGFKAEVEANYHRADRDKVLSILNADIPSETKKWRLNKLNDGNTYKYLIAKHMPLLRMATWVCIYATTPELKRELELDLLPDTIPAMIIQPIAIKKEEPVDTVVYVDEGWKPRLHIKTNTIGLAMGIANLAAELDINEHWSVSVPVYYSAWNYFKSTLKFRTFAIQPEVRYWWDEDHIGLFAGAHLGMSYFNFAFDGDYRYQDKNENSPALGGGLSIGYRLPLSKNNRWGVEFTLGAGVYSLQYDKFYNTDNVKEGLMADSKKKAYFGIDRAAISFSYALDLKKKGGKR